jgi:hypothetical protein
LFLTLLLLSPWLLGMKGIALQMDSIYNISGTIQSKSSGPVRNLPLFLEYSYSDTIPTSPMRIGSIPTTTDSNGNFDIRDSISYYDNSHGIIRIKVSPFQDSTVDLLFIDSAKRLEIPGQQSGCSSRSTPTQEIYTFPSQKIVLP